MEKEREGGREGERKREFTIGEVHKSDFRYISSRKTHGLDTTVFGRYYPAINQDISSVACVFLSSKFYVLGFFDSIYLDYSCTTNSRRIYERE